MVNLCSIFLPSGRVPVVWLETFLKLKKLTTYFVIHFMSSFKFAIKEAIIFQIFLFLWWKIAKPQFTRTKTQKKFVHENKPIFCRSRLNNWSQLWTLNVLKLLSYLYFLSNLLPKQVFFRETLALYFLL